MTKASAARAARSASAAKPVNPKGVVTFEHDGKRHTLAFNVNAIIAAEEAFDCGISQIAVILSGGVSAQEIRGQFVDALAPLKLDRNVIGKVTRALEPMMEYVAQATAQEGGTRFKHLRTLFRCALVDELPDLTDTQAGTMMGAIGMKESGALVTQAFSAAFHQEAGPDRPTAGEGAEAPK